MSLPSTKATTATATNAVVQAVETYIQNQNLLGEIAELDELLYDLIDLHKHNELALKRVLQCIYNLLQGNNKWNVRFGSKVFHKLISVIIADSTDGGSAHGLHRQLVANVLICVQIHARKFPRIDGKFLLRQLWSLSLSSERQPHAAQILVQLFDDFVRELGEECACSAQLYAVIQSFLQSEEREQRKSAYFLLRKLLTIMQATDSSGGLSTLVLESLKCNEHVWYAYVVIMETLEEQQSHLVVPTLSTLLPRIAESNQGDEWLIWLRILYVRLLQDNNILVLRWTLSFFFNRFDVTKLCRVKLLPEFLAATNRTQLYNVESYFLPAVDMEKFMSHEDDAQEFLAALVTVPWHSVPLHFWLSVMQPEKGAFTNKKVLLQLSSRVRTLRNSELRQEAGQRVFELFKPTIDSLTLGDYMVFIETLFNVSDDYYNDHQRLTEKMRNCENTEKEFVHFSKRCYEIMVRNSCITILVYELLRHLSKLPNSEHGWWRLFPLFSLNYMDPDIKEKCLDFYRTRYNVNTEMFETVASLEEVQQHLLQQFKCQTKDEKSFVLEHCVDCFVRVNIISWTSMKQLHLQPCDLLECGTKATFQHLAEKLELSATRIEDEANVLSTFVNFSKKHPNCENAAVSIVKYAAKFLSDDENRKLLTDIIHNHFDWIVWSILINGREVPNSLVIQGILDGEVTTGDARIEAAYTDSIIDTPFHDVKLRNRYIYFSKQQSEDIVHAVCAELLRINKELNDRKPRYFENCKEHRIKIRVARALLMMKDRLQWSDDLWGAVLAPNDQLNICFMYECLVAQLLPSFYQLLERMQSLGSLKPSQQVSIISVAHIYCLQNWKSLNLQHLQETVSLLLPHTMGAHYQTRLLAQLVLHSLAVKCEMCSIEFPILSTIKVSIEMTLGAKLHELENESRLLLPKILSEHAFPADVILYMTNTPFDEYEKQKITCDKLKANVEVARTAFKTKKNPITILPDALLETTNLNVQRKMNPINDIYNYNNLSKTEGQLNERELIVVASLIDKLPNLGGLARTCEVLGVKTLILGAKSFVDKSDFTNLSMTAEKTLNIIEVRPAGLGEYLIAKQSMGYKIVGAEQTAHSVSFADFKFPEKCILLLGHEKHGIPVDLIALLDYAVEIPQFGVVRSLNVHVTGSLFIWEYCKQYLNKK
ncbi:uncharacterized protein [Drosophila virilis]|uniref:tRNA (guanosine(18)-2'-O)-methyltransferase TARBP1 n=1 Tax=Drosophila virilis TaxID=7244 RepID=B4LXT1_DROVI|nr:uncharacterized protein LOC6629942 [Drosophila virilis]EDW67890.1 uncharacterized protein Dvir_GJ24409 [Drosophila virilis]